MSNEGPEGKCGIMAGEQPVTQRSDEYRLSDQIKNAVI